MAGKFGQITLEDITSKESSYIICGHASNHSKELKCHLDLEDNTVVSYEIWFDGHEILETNRVNEAVEEYNKIDID